MRSVWTEADRAAREAVEAELRRQGRGTPEALREVMSKIGPAVSIRALSLFKSDQAGRGLAEYVRSVMPA